VWRVWLEAMPIKGVCLEGLSGGLPGGSVVKVCLRIFLEDLSGGQSGEVCLYIVCFEGQSGGLV